MKFNMKPGIILSNAQICSAGIARLAMDGRKPHPLRKTHGILLDYSMLTMMLPMITLGSAFATIVGRLVPDAYLVIFYAIIMVGILLFNINRLLKLITKEKKDAENKRIAEESAKMAAAEQVKQVAAPVKVELATLPTPTAVQAEPAASESDLVIPDEHPSISFVDDLSPVRQSRNQSIGGPSPSYRTFTAAVIDSNPQEQSSHVQLDAVEVIVEDYKAEETDHKNADQEAKVEIKTEAGHPLKHPDDNDEIEYRSCFRRQTYTKKELRHVLEQKNSTLFQPDRLIQLFFVLAVFVILMLFRGAGDTVSVVGIKRCDPLDWTLLAILIVFEFVMTLVAIFMEKRDYEIKKAVNWEFYAGDYKFDFKNVWVFPACALVFSFTAILLGFTPAFLYITMLLQFELPPPVVVYTNACLTMFSTLCSTIIAFLFKTMPIDYFVTGLILSLIGAIPGIWLQSFVAQKTGKAQYSMMGFNTVILACLVAITAYNSYILVLKEKDNK
jgi:uncharacterized membrane protein YfcA